jgi:hypothetical protein
MTNPLIQLLDRKTTEVIKRKEKLITNLEKIEHYVIESGLHNVNIGCYTKKAIDLCIHEPSREGIRVIFWIKGHGCPIGLTRVLKITQNKGILQQSKSVSLLLENLEKEKIGQTNELYIRENICICVGIPNFLHREVSEMIRLPESAK